MVERPDVEASGAEEVDPRPRLRAMWASVAPAWERHAEYAERRGARVTRAMLERTSPQPGERVLELACGPGSVGLAAAALVAPDGEVVLSDVVPEMTAIAAARAEAAQLTNVATRVLDLEGIDEPDGLYDVVVCREGLMLVPDPVRAAREIARVLRRRGRTAVAVWGPRERNPWLAIVFDLASAQLGVPVPPPGLPHPFSLGGDGRLERVLLDAGLAEVDVTEVPVPYFVASVDEWWERSTALAGPLAQRLAALPPPAKEELRARAAEAVRPFETSRGLAFPGVCLLGVARRG
jgi:ubiquinone/menaquinone biosynthesis C-methylase UbiE